MTERSPRLVVYLPDDIPFEDAVDLEQAIDRLATQNFNFQIEIERYDLLAPTPTEAEARSEARAYKDSEGRYP